MAPSSESTKLALAPFIVICYFLFLDQKKSSKQKKAETSRTNVLPDLA